MNHEPHAAETAVLAAVAGYSVLLNRVIPRRAHIAANLGAASVAIALARADGATWRDLALSAREARAGLRTGLLAAVPIVAATAGSAAVPATQPQFRDPRVLDAPNPLFEIVLRIPVGTALCEELLFRSAALAYLEQHSSRARAIVTTSALFGVWHVLPARDAVATNARIALTVATTALAGAAFACLRYRSGSVLAPIVAHTAINASAFAAARLVQRREKFSAPNARTRGR